MMENENQNVVPVPQPDVEVEAEVKALLSNKEVDDIMHRCFFHRMKGKDDFCHYLHDWCMIGNKAPLPNERGMVADVCIRGY